MCSLNNCWEMGGTRRPHPLQPRLVNPHARHPRARNVLRAVVLASAGLLWAATLPIARASVTTPLSLVIFVGSFTVLATRKVDSLWVILSVALLQLTASAAGLFVVKRGYRKQGKAGSGGGPTSR
jgi:hypothetical protein